MHALSFYGSRFAADFDGVLNGLVRVGSHLVSARVERIANACDVAGLLAARRARRFAGEGLFRAAGREVRRRRSGLFGCFHYLNDLT